MKTIIASLAALCLVFIFFSCPVSAQSKEEAIRLTKEGEALQEQARSKDDLERAAEKYKQALRIYERLRDDKGILLEASSLGRVYGELGEYDKALEYCDTCVNVSRKTGHAGMEAECLFNLAKSYELRYQSKEDVERAIEKYEQALKIYERLSKEEPIASTNLSLGITYDRLGQYEKQWHISRNA